MKEKFLQIKISSIIQFFMYFFIFFPFIEFIHLGTDLQPYALLFSALYICCENNLSKFFKYQIQIAILVITIIIIIPSLFSKAPLSIVFRSCFHYFSICIIPIAVNFSLKNNEFNKEKIIKSFMIVWLLVGIIQISFNREFMSFIISDLRTSESRGVCSLAPEPSFYGYMCYFFIIISMGFKKNKKLFVILNILQILFLAQSSVGLLYVFIFFVFLSIEKCITNLSLKSVLYSCCLIFSIFIFYIVIINYMKGSRIQDLVIKLIDNPKSLIEDESISERVNAITVSIKSFISSFGIPNGFSKFITKGGRIMSGYGSLLHEMGKFGVFIIIYFWKLINQAYNKAVSTSMLITLFSAVQLGTPVFLFIIGYSIYQNEYQQNQNF